MMQTPLPLTRDIVLIGGGHAHALVLLKWAMAPLPGARLTLINPAPTAPYTGMLPGHVAGHYPREALEIDLVRLARHAGARLVLGRASGIDRQARRVQLPGRADIAYDIASLDIGITSDMPGLPGFAEHGHAAKPLGPFADAWARFVDAAAAGAVPARAVMIGGGVGGVELAMAMAWRLRQAGCRDAEVTVVEAAGEVLRDLHPGARAALRHRMQRLGLHLRTRTQVTALRDDRVVLAGGESLPSAFTAGAAGARPQDWLGGTGLHLTDGFVTVDRQLRSVTDPAIFAVGDCAHLSHAPRPKAGVYAVRAAPVLYRNLRAAASGRRLRSFRPQADYLKLISAGDRDAVADKFGLRAGGRLLWRLKDRIDRRFMARFQELPEMTPPPLPRETAEGVRSALAGGKPLCGGCGAKVGKADLAAALAALPSPRRGDVLSGPGDDAAILAHGDGAQVFTTDHLRAFVDDPWLLAQITAVHAMGDIWAMGGNPQAALTQVILPRMSDRLQAETLREILAAAAETFGAAGADVVGGHSSIGAELTIGYSVTGLVAGRPIGQDGARPGDALILTKPIGSGTILAAEMARAARGDWVAAAYDVMARPQDRAARILAGAHAMTDVTGFGLAGHLMGICAASGVAARLELDRIPLLAGAETLAAAGTRSTLWESNAGQSGRVSRPDGPRGDLLFDPQTAGGLLAALPQAAARSTLTRLHDAGETAAIIGEIIDGAPWIEAR